MDRKTFPTLAPPSEDPLQSGGQEEDRAGLQEVSWRFRALNPGDDLIHLSHLNFLTASSRKPSLLTSRPSCFFPSSKLLRNHVLSKAEQLSYRTVTD